MQSFDRPRFEDLLKKHQFEQTKIHIASFVDWRRKGLLNFVKSVGRHVLARRGDAIADPHLVVIAHRGEEGDGRRGLNLSDAERNE